MLNDFWEILVTKLTLDVYKACLKFNGSVISSIRSKQHNIFSGGEITSWHLDGLAYDVMLDSMDNSSELERQAKAFRNTLIVKGYRVISVKNGKNRTFHVQYSWPILKDFVRENRLSHLEKVLQTKYKKK